MADFRLPNELVVGDRVLVDADVDGRQLVFEAVILALLPDEIRLRLPVPGRLDALQTHQTVRLTVARDGGALSGHARFLRAPDSGKSRVFSVSRPGTLERVERRAKIRYEVDLPVDYHHLNPATFEPVGESSSGVTLNVGPGGMLFEADDTIDVGGELDISLRLSGAYTVRVNGIVKRARAAEASHRLRRTRPGRTEAAVEFAGITAHDRDMMARIIMTRETRPHAAETPYP